jgi:hypothetical protein
MHHYSFVRLDISSKLRNVSNRANYTIDVGDFVKRFHAWQPADGILHPHPNIGKHFKHVRVQADPFNIHLDLLCSYCLALAATRCARCKDRVYCSPECQHADWANHSQQCTEAVVAPLKSHS